MPDIVLTRDIAAGEFFTYKAPRPTDTVLIIGNIGAGADVSVIAARCEIRGSVGAMSFVKFHSTLAEGAQGAFNVKAGPVEGLVIDGDVGGDVVLFSNTGIRLRGHAGAGLLVDARGDFRANMLGDGAQIYTGREIAVTGVGARAKLKAGTRAFVTYLGEGSSITARQIVAPKASGLPHVCPQGARNYGPVGARVTHIRNGAGRGAMRLMRD